MKKFYFQVILVFVLSAFLGYFGMKFIVSNKDNLISWINSLETPFSVSNKSNLGKSFQNFTYLYNAMILENPQWKKFSLNYANIKEIETGYSCILSDGICIVADVNKNSKLIEKIVVASEPFKENTRENTNDIFSKQLEVYSIVAMIFSSKMRNPVRRDEILKNILDKTNQNFFVFDGVRYQAIFIEDAVILSIESASNN